MYTLVIRNNNIILLLYKSNMEATKAKLRPACLYAPSEVEWITLMPKVIRYEDVAPSCYPAVLYANEGISLCIL